ncbi:MAG: alpha-galactosidase [Prolixibacteraceae bacterium]|nr:alpha-galactosidase [Prolixibacteraceae bacterium]
MNKHFIQFTVCLLISIGFLSNVQAADIKNDTALNVFHDLNVENIEIEVSFNNGRQIVNTEDFIFNGTYYEWYDKVLNFEILKKEGGYLITPTITSTSALHCDYIKIIFRYKADKTLQNSMIFSYGSNVFEMGFETYMTEYLKPRNSNRGGTHCGIYHSSRENCVFLGVVIPLKNKQTFKITPVDKRRAKFETTTHFLKSHANSRELAGEQFWFCTSKNPMEAFTTYADFVPLMPEEELAPQLIGWNSWECYLDAITENDILENVENISKDPVLRNKIESIVIDDGWQHRWGEWFPNYRFSNGMDLLADKIKSAGFIPGIWIHGPQYQDRSYPSLTRPDLFLQAGRTKVMDPTHPEGAKEIYETFKRLYDWGYRIFKVDYVSDYIQVESGFYDKDAGVYDAIRQLFDIIRSAVGEESHIIGCGFPAGVGPGYVNSSRVGVDIHSHWNNVKWVCEFLQVSYWQNGRLYRVDPDFITVRGRETAEVSEVYSPVEYTIERVWNAGEYLTFDEAQTWARIVKFYGGNLFLSDQISKLNERGKTLIVENLETLGTSAKPIDLGENRNASIWYHYETNTLLVINFEDDDRIMEIDVSKYGIAIPGSISSPEDVVLKQGIIKATLRKHQSAVIKML